jgi:hypothetical protein
MLPAHARQTITPSTAWGAPPAHPHGRQYLLGLPRPQSVNHRSCGRGTDQVAPQRRTSSGLRHPVCTAACAPAVCPGASAPVSCASVVCQVSSVECQVECQVAWPHLMLDESASLDRCHALDVFASSDRRDEATWPGFRLGARLARWSGQRTSSGSGTFCGNLLSGVIRRMVIIWLPSPVKPLPLKR